MLQLITLLTLLLVAPLSAAALEVAATTPNMAMLVRTVAAEHARVTVLAPGDRDVHTMEALPSMMVALRRADLLVAVGAELEVGWLPAAIRNANNPRVLPGRPGYFEAAAQVTLIDVGLPADRALGDVHPMGNPHLYFDPVRMGVVAEALAERLGELDPANALQFRANAAEFAARAAASLSEWRGRVAGAPGVLLYHKDANYLMEALGVPVLGFIEPIPGIPPTARHISELVRGLEGQSGVIFHMIFQQSQGAQRLGSLLGWPVHRMASNVSPSGTATDYFQLLEAFVVRLEQARG